MSTRRPSRPTLAGPRHERVYDLLCRLVSDGVADFLADACTIHGGEYAFRTKAHIVSHLVREVESAVRQVLITLPAARQHFEEDPSRKKARHRAEVDAVLAALGLQDEAVAEKWRGFVGDEAWHSTAHRLDLGRPRSFDAEFSARFDRMVDVLSVVLDAAEAKYAEALKAIDSLIAKPTPAAADVDFLATYLGPGATALAHIFEKLSPSWLLPLRSKGVFAEPPDIYVHEDGAWSFPYWPQAAYLKRIASTVPADVAETIVNVPTVDNESIHWLFLEAAAQMPVKDAVRVAIHELVWLSTHKWGNAAVPNHLRQLIVRVVSDGEVETARDLLSAALRLEPSESQWSRPGVTRWSLRLGLRTLHQRSA